MTDILEEIVRRKRVEVTERREKTPEKELMKRPAFSRTCLSLKRSLADTRTSGIITEFKKRSPSKGAIHEDADVAEVTTGYARYGASGLSVLTDGPFFGGSTADLETARAFNRVPILRKDFVIDPYQVIETKAMGADIMLLIAECLSPAEVSSLASLARGLGLEVLLEMHSGRELGKIGPDISLVGINNRDLKTFRVDIERSIQLGDRLPDTLPRIAESGIDDPHTLLRMRDAGFDGFLMGEHFMKQPRPEEAFRDFLSALPPRRNGARSGGKPRLKICGLSRAEDLREAAASGAAYAGMIFHAPSPRFAEGRLVPEAVRAVTGVEKVGVFVNATLDYIVHTRDTFGLDFAQLHGDESPEACRQVRAHLPVIKAFRIRGAEDFAQLGAYRDACDYFLFDAHGDLYGGNGTTFDWRWLDGYAEDVPFFLSGGIGPESVAALKGFSHPRFYGIDVNSRFEVRPGEKNIQALKQFIWDLNII